MRAALGSLVERWTVKEDMEADEWMRVEIGEGLRLLTLEYAVSQDLAARSCAAIAEERV